MNPERAQAIDYLLRAADAVSSSDIARVTHDFRRDAALELPLQLADESSSADLELARAFCRAWATLDDNAVLAGDKWREAARTLADALYAGRMLTAAERALIARLAEPGERKPARRPFWRRWFRGPAS